MFCPQQQNMDPSPSQSLFFITQTSDAFTLLLTFLSPELTLFFKSPSLPPLLSLLPFPTTLNQHSDQQFLLTSPYPLELAHFVSNLLSTTKWLVLRNMKLNETDRRDFFFGCKLVNTVLAKCFDRGCVVQEETIMSTGNRIPKGSLIVFYDSTRTSEKLAQDKSYELEGLRKETVTIVCDEFYNIEALRLQHRKLVLQAILINYGEVIKKIVKEVDYMQVLRFEVVARKYDDKREQANSKSEIEIEYLGFKKNQYKLYEKLENFLTSLKFGVYPFIRPTQQRRQRLSDLITQINQRKGNQLSYANLPVRPYLLINDFVICFENTQLHQQIDQFIKSEPHLLTYSPEQLIFIDENFDEICKLIKRQVDLCGIARREKGVELLCDLENYVKAGEIIAKFIANKILVDQRYWFRKESWKHTFIKYFANQLNIKNLTEDPEDVCVIYYQTQRINTESVNQKINDCEAQIRKNNCRLLVPTDFQLSYSRCLSPVTSTYTLPNPLLSPGLQLTHCHNPIRLRFLTPDHLQTTPLSCLLLPYDGQFGQFLSPTSKTLMQQHKFYQGFMKTYEKEFKKKHSHTYINDSDCHLKQFVCFDWGISEKSIPEVIEACGDRDGLGLVVPNGKADKGLVLEVFLEQVARFTETKFKEKKELKNIYLVCEQRIKEVQKFAEKFMNTELKVPPLRLDLLQVYRLKILPHNTVTVSNPTLKPSSLTALLLALQILSPENPKKPLILNLPNTSDQNVQQLLLDFDSKKAYSLTQCQKLGFTQFGNTITPLTNAYMKHNYEVTRNRTIPRLITMFRKDGEIIGNFFKVTGRSTLNKVVFVQGVAIDASEEDPDYLVEYKLVSQEKRGFRVVEGYADEVLQLAKQISK